MRTDKNAKAPPTGCPNLAEAVSELRKEISQAFRDSENVPEHILRRGRRLEIPLNPSMPNVEVDPFHWLLAQPHVEKTLWSCRDSGDVTAGVGCCHLLNGASVEDPGRLLDRGREILADFEGVCPRYFGGFSFSSASVDEAPWQIFGRSRFLIPRFEVARKKGRTSLVCNLLFQRHVHLDRDQLLAELDALVCRMAPPEALPPITERADFPDRAGWEANVRAGLDLIASGILDKVVLARKAVYSFAEPVDPIHILSVLRPVTSNCYHFLIQPSGEAAFMGTTPECLYRREGRELNTEALAGTRPREKDAERDAVLAAQLLENPKERREQELVRRDLLRQLHLLSTRVDADETPSLLRLERKQHLISRIRARLRDGVGDADLLQALHPTPAVGGSPRVNALKEIPRLEPFSRGWYAAPVGWFGPDAAEFAVAIRSGLVRDHRVNVYSGAGIVEGSDPSAEWAEIENKISDFVKVTQYRPSGRAANSVEEA